MLNLAGKIDMAITAIHDKTYQLSEVEANELYLSIDKLAKQLKKVGFTRAKS